MMNENKINPTSQIINLYNQVAADYGQVGPRILDHFGQRLVQIAGVGAKSHVLDIASGRGASLFPAAESVHPGGMAIGSDLSFQMTNQIRLESQREGLKNIHVLQMDGDSLAFPSMSFDFVLCGFAIFLFPKPIHTFFEWHRVLRPTAKLGVCVASQGDEKWEWYEALLFKYHQQYQFPLSASKGGIRKPDKIKELMEKVGFNNIELREEIYEFRYANVAQWWQAKWTHGARFPLERMGEAVLKKFEEEVFRKLQELKETTDLREKWQIAYIIGVK